MHSGSSILAPCHTKARAARHPAQPHAKSIQHQCRLLHKSRNSLTTVTKNPDKYNGVQYWPESVKKKPQKKWSCQSILKTAMTRNAADLYHCKQFITISSNEQYQCVGYSIDALKSSKVLLEKMLNMLFLQHAEGSSDPGSLRRRTVLTVSRDNGRQHPYRHAQLLQLANQGCQQLVQRA